MNLTVAFALALGISGVLPLLASSSASALAFGQTELRLSSSPTNAEVGTGTTAFTVKEVSGLGGDGWTNTLTSFGNATITATAVNGEVATSCSSVNWGATAVKTIPAFGSVVEASFCYRSSTYNGAHSVSLTSNVPRAFGSNITDTVTVPITVVDTVSPTQPTPISPNGWSNNKNVTFTWTSSTDLSPVSYEVITGNHPNVGLDGKLQNGVVSRGTSTTTSLTKTMADGPYSWQVQATDAAGNKSAWSPVSYLTLDSTAPSVTNFQQVYNASKNRVDVTLTFSEVINQSSLGQGWNAVGNTNTIFTKAYYNSKTYNVTFTDIIGNQGSYGFTTDFTKPTVTNFAQVYNAAKNRVDVTLTFSEELNPDTLGQGWNAVGDTNTVFTKAYYNSKAHTVTFADLVGNPGEYTFTTDFTAPTAVVTYSNNNGNAVTKDDVTVTLTANEAIQTPAGWTKVNSTTFTKVYSANGNYSVVIADLVGNPKTVNYEVKRIDRINPVITGVTDGASYTTAVSYVVTEQSLSKIFVDGVSVPFTHKGGWNYAGADITSLGAHTIKAIDKAGNSTIVNFTVVAPTPVLLQEDDEQTPAGTATTASTTLQLLAARTTTAVATTANANGQVLGDSTATLGTNTKERDTKEVKGVATTTKTSAAFLGLGWWWLLVLAVIAMITAYFVAARRADNA